MVMNRNRDKTCKWDNWRKREERKEGEKKRRWG